MILGGGSLRLCSINWHFHNTSNIKKIILDFFFSMDTQISFVLLAFLSFSTKPLKKCLYFSVSQHTRIASKGNSHENALIFKKSPTGLDGHLSTIDLRWTYQGFQCLHFRLHFGVYTLIRDSSAWYPHFYYLLLANINLLRGEQESQDSRIIYTQASGAKNCKPLVKRNLQAFNCQFFFIKFSFIYNACNVHTVYCYKQTMQWKLKFSRWS